MAIRVRIEGREYPLDEHSDRDYHVTHTTRDPATGDYLHKRYTCRLAHGIMEIRTSVLSPLAPIANNEPFEPGVLGEEQVETRALSDFIVPETPPPQRLEELPPQYLEELKSHFSTGPRPGVVKGVRMSYEDYKASKKARKETLQSDDDAHYYKLRSPKQQNQEALFVEAKHVSASNPSAQAFLDAVKRGDHSGKNRTAKVSLKAGHRIYIQVGDQIHSATVVKETQPNAFLVCTDVEVSPRFCYSRPNYVDWCGARRAVIVARHKIVGFLSDFLPRNQVYQDLPWHIVVSPRDGSLGDSVDSLPPGVFGRPLSLRTGASEASLTICVSNWSDNRFWPYSTDDGYNVSNCWNAPTSKLRWGRVSLSRAFKSATDLGTRLDYLRQARLLCRWPGGGKESPEVAYKAGQYLVYRGEKPLTIPTGGRSNKPYVLSRGGIVQYLGPDKDHGPGYIRISLPEGLIGEAAKLAGYHLRVGSRDVAPFDETYLLPQTPIEVTANVVFRKRSLQGWKGRVILPTDEDGDVGVEFEEDFGAGSLDGLGQQGKCLYIPIGALKVRG